MAKSLARFAPRPIIVSMPRRSGGRFRRAAHVARRAGRAVARHGRKSLPTVSVAIGGLVVGYADGRGMLNSIPAIGGSRMNTLALLGWAATRFTRNASVRAAGLAMLGAATYAIGAAQGASSKPSAQGDDGGAGPGGGLGRPY